MGKVGNLFMIFFRHPRVNFALIFVAICDNLGQENRGIKAFKLNISQEIFGFLRVILTSEIKLKTPFRKHHFPHGFTKS